MVDRTGDYLEELATEAKKNEEFDEADILRDRLESFTPHTELASQCYEMLCRVRDKKREVEKVTRDVASTGTQDTQEDLEALELECLAACADYDRRIMLLRESLGCPKALWNKVDEMLEEGIKLTHKEVQKLHLCGVLEVVSSHLESFTLHLHKQKGDRRSYEEKLRARRETGAFGTIHLTEQQQKDIEEKRRRLHKDTKLQQASGMPGFRGLAFNLGFSGSSTGNADSSASIDGKNSSFVEESKDMLTENQQLQKQLESEAIEEQDLSHAKLMDMSTMMTAFNQKVFEQAETVTEIAMTEETARLYTQEGVKQLKSATDKSRDQSTWLLTIIYLSAFSILFLDWYGS